MKWVIFVNNMVCPLLLLPGKKGKNMIKFTKTIINTVNRFTTLVTIPKPNYSSVLASTYDPYTLIHSHQPVQTVFPRNPNASQYVKKRYVQNLFSVEPNRASITNPFH